MRDVLIDASSAILLFKAALIDLAAEAWSLTATPSVLDELAVSGQPGARTFQQMADAGRLRIAAFSPRPADRLRNRSRMGIGERDTLALYRSGTGDFIIIDDGPAAAFCRTHRIPYINALLVPRILAISGREPASDWPIAMETVFRIGRYAEAIAAYARSCPDQRLVAFLP